MESYYGDIFMFLKELMELTNINLSLSAEAQNIEVHDDFRNNPVLSINETEITITCSHDDVIRAINFNFDKNTIAEVFNSPAGIGGGVYTMTGLIVKIIN